VKERGIIDETNKRIAFTQSSALEFVDLVKKIVPQVGPHGGSSLLHKYNKWVRIACTIIQIPLKKTQLEEVKECDEQHPQKVILIRRADLNLHKYDTRNKNLIKMLQTPSSTVGEAA
jgi:hypothetical protein